MNKKQTIVLWVGLSIILLMGIFPPWVYIWNSGHATGQTDDAGYNLILIPPKPKDDNRRNGIKLDVPRLCVQWVTVAVVAGGLILTFRDKKKV